MAFRLLLLLFLTSSVDAQDNYIEFELRFNEPEQQFNFSPFDSTSVTVVVRNNGPCPYLLFETWNTWGYYTAGFEIETPDHVYFVKHQESIWFRNFESVLELAPGDSTVFEFNLRDSAYVNDIWEDAWVGLPEQLDGPATIRFRYELTEEAAKVRCLTASKKEYVQHPDDSTKSFADVKHPHTIQGNKHQYFVDEDMLLGTFYSAPISIQYGP